MKKVDLHIHTVATVSDHYFEFSMDALQSYVECKELDDKALDRGAITLNYNYKIIVFSQLKTRVWMNIQRHGL